MNLGQLLNKSIIELCNVGIPTPELDARILLEYSIEKDRAFTFSHPEFLITNAQYARFRRYIRRRKTGEPIAYILGHKEFYGLDFFVNTNVLVPRPETEQLVEWGIKYIKKQLTVNCQPLTALDMGTGCGCIIISLAKTIKKQFSNLAIEQLNFCGAEISSRALTAAKKNAKTINAQNIVFLNSDLFSNPKLKRKIFDLIIANLPYVPRSFEIDKSITHEPHDAIFADDNGSSIIKKFLSQAKDRIATNGLMLLELDPRNATDIHAYAKKCFPNGKIELKKDLAGLYRYLIIKK